MLETMLKFQNSFRHLFDPSPKFYWAQNVHDFTSRLNYTFVIASTLLFGTRHFAYRQFVHSLDSPPTVFHVVCALIQFYNVQQELCDHYRYGSRMNSRMSILTVTVREVYSRRSVENPVVWLIGREYQS